jgi:hypothetical protein
MHKRDASSPLPRHFNFSDSLFREYVHSRIRLVPAPQRKSFPATFAPDIVRLRPSGGYVEALEPGKGHELWLILRCAAAAQ